MRVAVVLYNMGGPNGADEVEEFLFNLFNDRAIINLSPSIRKLVAKIISKARKSYARREYEKIGGKSPLLNNTVGQAEALEKALRSFGNVRCFVAMRYSRPTIAEAIKEIEKYGPDVIVQLPLYPQFSYSTTASCLNEFDRDFRGKANVRVIKSFPNNPGFIDAIAKNAFPILEEAKKFGDPKILFSAHGLPEKRIRAGDPYQRECEMTVAALVERLSLSGEDFVLCYQSRIGPLKWIGPETKEEIAQASKEGRPIVVAPISFVCENLETLAELKINYRKIAEKFEAPFYGVVPAVGKDEDFINGLAGLIRGAAL